MLLAHPAVLEDLVERYKALAVLRADQGSAAARQEFEDIAYSLCVATGTSDVDAALVAASHRLPGARVTDDSLLSA
ncbi:DUF5133 domain-containing protein [Streptomyces alboniger]|uniref:DUF5133 domain-containing protein n=1 Tax=Streptomyces alboniger TaxID=132473 RepID=A0A5J6HWW1_STRAD|nr:DUF5133 domain-containing protein [Streptomyces alboniger]QEV21487.1 DUF5133 domain-containing protein [Streptomyces alboniger]